MDSYGSDFATPDFDFACEDPVSCMLCDEQFQVIPDEQPLLKHLVTAHKFVIGEAEEIADFRQYALYWRKLYALDLRDYCVVFNTNGEPGSKLPSETFFLLCKKLPEDYVLRSTLKQLKLQYTVNQKEKERNDTASSRKCIYCDQVIAGGIANAFHHLTFDHGFSLGNPDNIVNGARLLDVLEEKLKRLQCLCCEKIFVSQNVLRDHMRKKQHRCLNPKNKMYDKFYLLNYLEPGTPWQVAKQHHDTESEVDVVHIRSPRTEEETTWKDWREDEISSTTCLFCNFTTSQVPGGLYHHMKNYHQFDFDCSTKHLSFYEKVKVVNFVRTRVRDLRCLQCPASFPSQDSLRDHLTKRGHCSLPDRRVWDLQEFLIPVMNSDGLLCHLEDNDVEDENKIIPEDLCRYDNSVLEDNQLRDEIIGAEEIEMGVSAMCLFCCYAASGKESQSQIFIHMEEMHSFDFAEVMCGLPIYSQVKLINFIRWKTAKGECYICGKVFKMAKNLEEHRVLVNHLVVPQSNLFEEERWLQPVLECDGLLVNLREEGDSEDEELGAQDSSHEIIPEDVCHYENSILEDEQLRGEIIGREEVDMDVAATCLFCSFTASGKKPQFQIFTHMEETHSFDFVETMCGLPIYSKIKLINFIRLKTSKCACYICGHSFPSAKSLEEHRVMLNHLSVPQSNLFEDERWLQPVLECDGLLVNLREEGDSEDEDTGGQDSSHERVFSEDILLPSLNSSTRQEALLKSMKEALAIK